MGLFTFEKHFKMTNYIKFIFLALNLTLTQQFNPSTGKELKVKYNPETGEVINENIGPLKEHKQKKISTKDKFKEIESIKKTAIKDAFSKDMHFLWDYAGMAGIASGFILGVSIGASFNNFSAFIFLFSGLSFYPYFLANTKNIDPPVAEFFDDKKREVYQRTYFDVIKQRRIKRINKYLGI
mgnify:CR=1 FL=1